MIKDVPEYNGAGVYALVDENGKKYIGSAKGVYIRCIAQRDRIKMNIQKPLSITDGGFSMRIFIKYDKQDF